ncbi:MAG: hypothetical protein WEB59_08300 [Thermoanaerobaculia bacterium]
MDANRPAGQSHGVAAEPDRVSAKIVVGFGVLIIGLCAVAMVLVVVLFKGLEKGADRKDEKSLAAAGTERKSDAPPPLPRLQVYPVEHWKDFQQAERERLATYGWMDHSSGAVHIPIDRAMDLIAERGVEPLPAAPMAMPGTDVDRQPGAVSRGPKPGARP